MPTEWPPKTVVELITAEAVEKLLYPGSALIEMITKTDGVVQLTVQRAVCARAWHIHYGTSRGSIAYTVKGVMRCVQNRRKLQ